MTINLNVKSIVGFRNSTATIVGPEPLIETITTLEGFPGENRPKPRAILEVSTVSNYSFVRTTTSTSQTIYLYNKGSANLTIRNIRYSGGGAAVPSYNTSTWLVTGNVRGQHTATTVISPGSQASFNLAYFSNIAGTYTNSVEIITDGYGSSYIPSDPRGVVYRMFTVQEINNNFYLRLSPPSRVTTSTIYGQNTLHTFNIVPTNGTTSSYAASLTGSPGFSIYSLDTSQVRVMFNNTVVNNVTGTYTATLLVSAFGGTASATASLRHDVNVDTSKYINYGSWLSPVAPDNSAVGISYDKIDGVRTVTLGLGAGGDGGPSLLNNGRDSLLAINLGLQADELLEPYRYWARVYRIPLVEGQAKTYYSLDYRVKEQGTDYDFYFGENRGPQSIFIVDSDQYGNVTIKINRLREIPEDSATAITVQNLTRAFHYYSEADIGGRYNQLGVPTGDGTQTELFTGFYNNGTVVTNLVKYPL